VGADATADGGSGGEAQQGPTKEHRWGWVDATCKVRKDRAHRGRSSTWRRRCAVHGERRTVADDDSTSFLQVDEECKGVGYVPNQREERRRTRRQSSSGAGEAAVLQGGGGAPSRSPALKSGQMDSPECREGGGCLQGGQDHASKRRVQGRTLAASSTTRVFFRDRVQEKGRVEGGGPAVHD
jgi:hypothetical protein